MIHLLGILLFSGSLAGAYTAKHLTRGKNGEEIFTPAPKSPSDKLILPKAQNTLVTPRIGIEQEAELNHYLQVAGVGLVLAAAGHLLYFPLGLLSLPILGYVTLDVFENAYECLKEKELRISVLESTAIGTGIGSGLYALSAFATVIYFASSKMLYKTRHKTQSRLTDIFSGHPPTVWLLKDGVEISVPLEQIRKGDRIVINTGEMVPIDGIVEEGIATLDQHMLTGEAQPEERTVDQQVFATTLVISGRITVRVEQTGAETVAAHIAAILDHTDSYISTLQIRSEQLANDSVAPTLGLAGFALLITGPMSMAVVLCSNFSDVMSFTVPLGMLNYLRIASRAGLLIKDGRSLEQLLKVDTVVFDKTGTLTLEQPHVSTIYPAAGFTEQQVLFYTAAAEYRQTHPIAKAVLDAAAKQGLELPLIDEAQYRIGYGLRVNLEGQVVRVGSVHFMQRENIVLPESFAAVEQNAHQHGYSLIYTAVNEALCGAVELRPTVRPEAAQVVRHLYERGLQVYILSGDHEGPVKNLAAELGIDAYIAETLPEDKSKVIEKLQQQGKSVCFVGDGINDSIALKKAAVSVSLQDASHVAMDSAQIILTNKNLMQLLDALDIAKRFGNNQKLTINLGVVAPSLICMGGGLFLGFTVTNTLVFYCASAALGVGSAMLPLLQEHRRKE
ncbi:cation transport ATPase [Thioploca ingrica]|uniref:Cation transport ATPase n=1 Tax=Thioploca ingrica TaxID=40754 RepID=A0A090AMB5_9GAMM|nr:cation transport ATPase [Thioploca ingrica]